MSTALYKEFTIRSPSVWQVVVAFVKANAQACIERGTCLRVIFTTEERKRNTEQNRYYWGAVLRQISMQAYVGGKQFDADTWHEYYARKFGVCEDVPLPSGEVIVRRKSTTQMTVGEFSDYLNRVIADAAQELAVEFDQFGG